MALATPAAARAVVRQIADMEEEGIADARLQALRRDPEWLQLPTGRRHGALQRYRILQRYDRIGAPTKADATTAAVRLGVQLRTFYAMLRDWRDRGRSPLALVRYRPDEPTARSSRLDPVVARRLLDDVRKLLGRDPGVAPGKAVRAIQEGWPESLKAPSGVTIRAYLERERTGTASSPGSARLDIDEPGGGKISASRFGEVVVIDQATPARLLLLQPFGAAANATITLVIDVWSGAPIGAAVSDGPPGPGAALDALADARARMEAIGAEESVRPRVVYAAMPDVPWHELRGRLTAAELDVAEIPEHRLPLGAPTRTLVGSRLGTVPLAASFGRRPKVGIDLDQEALLTMNQMMFLVDASVEAVIAQKLPATGGRRGTRLDLPAFLTVRGSLRSRTRPLLEVRPDDEGPAGVPSNSSGGPVAAFDRPSAAELRRVAAEAVGPSFVRADVSGPAPDQSGRLVRVQVTAGSDLADVWLNLARAAVRLVDGPGVKVRFEVALARCSAERD